MGKVTHRRRTPRSQGGGCSAQPVGLRRRRRGPGQVPHESSARWRGLRTQCPPPSELAAAQETALPPTAVIIFVHSIRRVSVGYVGVISPSASHWLLQVLEIANSRRVVAPRSDNCLWRQATRWQTANRDHAVSSRRVQCVPPAAGICRAAFTHRALTPSGRPC